MNLYQIKKKIESISKIKKITESMKIIATSKLNKVKNKISHISDFQKKIYQTISLLGEETRFNNHKKNTLWIVFTSTLGMAGSFNINIFKMLDANIKEDDRIIIFGEKGRKRYSKDMRLFKTFSISEKNISFYNVKYAADLCTKLYSNNYIGNIKLIYSKWANNRNSTNLINVLPMDKALLKNKSEHQIYLFEPSKSEIMENLVSLYIESIIYASFMDSKFAENSSRKNAMTQANKNIDDIVNTLHIQYNKRRQERITSELQNNG